MIMTNVRNFTPGQISRRSLLGGAICASGAATMLVAANTQPAQAAKISQSVVKYQDSPKGEQKCSNCKLFTAPNACQTVDGTVSPDGWCMIYQKA
jgi:High potential iron-sulfur protein